jgi:threonine/homoserine/homoserine lactone efflux protein
MLVLAASPGPGVFATIARALASGFRPSFAVICGIVLGCVLGAYAFLANRARRMFTNQQAVKRLNRAAGGVMVAAGIAIAVRS